MAVTTIVAGLRDVKADSPDEYQQYVNDQVSQRIDADIEKIRTEVYDGIMFVEVHAPVAGLTGIAGRAVRTKNIKHASNNTIANDVFKWETLDADVPDEYLN